MNNVISFNRNEPADLMKISELVANHGYKYGYLYKWSVLAKKQGLECIEPYYKGGLKLSLKEVMEFDRKKGMLKYGRN